MKEECSFRGFSRTYLFYAILLSVLLSFSLIPTTYAAHQPTSTPWAISKRAYCNQTTTGYVYHHDLRLHAVDRTESDSVETITFNLDHMHQWKFDDLSQLVIEKKGSRLLAVRRVNYVNLTGWRWKLSTTNLYLDGEETPYFKNDPGEFFHYPDYIDTAYAHEHQVLFDKLGISIAAILAKWFVDGNRCPF